jgi:sigma-B regulation protein RsbU (phosphoserine phosphatase)
MVEASPSSATRPWRAGEDLLFLFTDGVSDARNRFDARLGEQPATDIVCRYRTEAPDVILHRVLDELEEHAGGTVQRDDLALVLMRG